MDTQAGTDRSSRPPLRWRLLLAALTRLPQGALSRAAGGLADLPIPRPLRPALLGLFARATGIDLSEAELPLVAYPSVNGLFVRRLKPGLRPIPDDHSLLVSPVDGVVGASGSIEQGRLLQAKGRWYTAAGLLDDGEQAKRYHGGSFVTLYLSPRHYHRIHSPCPGQVRLARHIPGGLLPVNQPAVVSIQGLFARNERLICYIDGPAGRVAVVAVGAFNVGRISAAFDAGWNHAPGGSGGGSGGVSNRRGATAATRHYDPPPELAAGDEIMAFHLGSTVVMLFEPGRARLQPALATGDQVQMAQPIATVPSLASA